MQGPITQELSALSKRYYLASLEVMEDPEQYQRVRSEVVQAIDELAVRFGRRCIDALDRSGVTRLGTRDLR